MIPAAVQRVLRAGCFFVAPPHRLRIEHAADETVRWEIFRGQLLDPAHTRLSECFAVWHVFLDEESPAAAPLLRPGGVVVADREMRVAGWTPAPLDATSGNRRHYLYRIDRP